ncbi:hypothetical protein ABD87_22955 [Lysinibacillus sphaericus]|uniref:hypothetical protein n=1 Tax=Lysinibacillus sphaericus TaxID=1421 RepID=UPI0018CF2FB4|nr:hypothetical protein [Lysinibacillus sphaericus]MBG9732287.1 hypothetical protein [Lysinibacillus sphaericus]
MSRLNITTNFKESETSISSPENKKKCELLLKHFQQLLTLSTLQEKDNRSYLSAEDDECLTLLLKGLYLLDEKEREVLRLRYIDLDENGKCRYDYEVVSLLNISERTYFRIKASAFGNYGAKLRKFGLWIVNENETISL